jgi:hypothetical protein
MFTWTILSAFRKFVLPTPPESMVGGRQRVTPKHRLNVHALQRHKVRINFNYVSTSKPKISISLKIALKILYFPLYTLFLLFPKYSTYLPCLMRNCLPTRNETISEIKTTKELKVTLFWVWRYVVRKIFLIVLEEPAASIFRAYTLVAINQTTRRHIPDDRIGRSHKAGAELQSTGVKRCLETDS